jgi:uncharacterized protein with PIN domain
MCGGLARWLRALGCDAFYREGIEDQELVDRALNEDRTVITSDTRLLERKLFTEGRIRSLALPHGLKLPAQLDFVVGALGLEVQDARCTLCNGELTPVSREAVADIVPARSLIWAREFFRCGACGHVFWDGTHWGRITAVRRQYAKAPKSQTPPGADPASEDTETPKDYNTPKR